MITILFFIIVGFSFLIFGANWLVDGASSLAKKYHVSDLVIGLTIVAFGTSMPEMVVNIIASNKGYSEIVLGNIIGSNNFNLFVILGLSGLIFPIMVQSSTAWKEIPISLFAAVLLLFMANDFFLGQDTALNRIEGAVLLFLFFSFLFYIFRQMRFEEGTVETATPQKGLKMWTLIFIGLAGLIFGGQIVVDNSVELATKLGLSKKIIGLTIVAAGTSLPELVTSVVAAIKKNSDIAVGNVIGSNVFNILLILSISTLISPISYQGHFNIELYILIGGTLFLLLSMITGTRKKLDRWEAGILLGFYLAYTLYVVVKEL